MKKLFFLATILMALISCSRDNNESNPPEPKLILKTENLSFQEGTPMPEALPMAASCISIYHQGFLVSNGKTYVYKTNTNTWSFIYNELSDSKGDNYNVQWPNIIGLSSQYMFFNGINYQKNIINDAINYGSNMGAGSWSFGGLNPSPVRSAGTAFDGSNTIYMVGGSKLDGSFSNKVYKISVNFPNGYSVFSEISQLPEAKETQCELVNNKIYVIGGYNGTTSKRIDVYDLSTNKWTFLGNMPYGFSSHSTCVQGSKIWIVGNYNFTDQQLAYYNTATNEFVSVNSNIIPRRHLSAEVFNNKLYVIGGVSSSNTVLKSVQVANIP